MSKEISASKEIFASKEISALFAKADNNTPSTNPDLKEICDQLGDIREYIEEEINISIKDDDTRWGSFGIRVKTGKIGQDKA